MKRINLQKYLSSDLTDNNLHVFENGYYVLLTERSNEGHVVITLDDEILQDPFDQGLVDEIQAAFGPEEIKLVSMWGKQPAPFHHQRIIMKVDSGIEKSVVEYSFANIYKEK